MKEIFNKILNSELLTKDAKLYMFAIVCIWASAIFYFFPPLVSKMLDQQKQISTVSTQIIDLEKKKVDIATAKAEHNPTEILPITIFKSPYPSTDIESAAMELVYRLLKIIGSTGNKITEIAMTPNAKTDNDPAGSLNVSMSINCNYVSLQNLLQKISTWEYLSEIKNISIEPVNGDENNLTAKLSINLYVIQ